MSLLNYVSPFRLYHEYVIKPVQRFILDQYAGYKKKTDAGISSVKELVYRAAIVLVFLTAILWISIFLYVIFYYTYMPNVTHVRPVHLQFKSCEEQMGVCSFLTAHVQLTKRSHMLMTAQPYRIKLVMELPESPVNKDLGMFMVCAQLRAKGGILVSSSCRSAMLRHRSYIHHVLRTLFYAPFLISSINEEKQQLQVELFTDFEDDHTMPVTDAYVELQSRHVQVYSCELHVHAHFSGLRHLMYHWPNLAALLGISTNLFFVSLVFILSWYHLQESIPDFVKIKFKSDHKNEEHDKKFVGKVKLEREDSSSFFEGDTLLEEFRQIEELKKAT